MYEVQPRKKEQLDARSNRSDGLGLVEASKGGDVVESLLKDAVEVQNGQLGAQDE